MRKAQRVDLHSHSTASDGVLTPPELVKRAAQNRVALFALTDHDTVAGLTEAREAARQLGVLFVAGVEISVSFAGETIHLVGLGIDETDPVLTAGLEQVRRGRTERARKMAEALEACGFAGVWEGALRFVRHPDLISRAHFARYLVHAGHFPSMHAVFTHYLAKGKPGYVDHHWATLGEAVSWIHAAGGVAVVAHPGRYRLNEREWGALLTEFVDLGGEAIEVVTSAHDHNATTHWAQICRRYGLAASQGSDFHAPDESPWDLGAMGYPLPDDLVPVWQRWQ
ncbi:3',5'-nucleoside bisphosphate phosphatase [Hydrogenophilus thiooxidans]|uniref:3',5'-nucleoside bisphosphate phosphatase n=1 Tax=Hydrogenophilus thiooxidans TaxID=2820326 RepID=UPI001C2271B1|nr:3',5'-nucleoside bisphosphate phosphatase [Hydrogenophilus thiooxidans]